MTLLVTVFAAIISTAVWYKNSPGNKMNVGFLSLMFWGASLMWSVDAIFEYVEDPKGFFAPAPYDILIDLCLGLCVIALGGVIWIVSLLIKDPINVFKLKKDK